MTSHASCASASTASEVQPEPRLVVALGLRRLIQRGTWPAEHLLPFQNLLLDECGGDARPLVALLMRVAEQGIAEDLASISAEQWESCRSQYVTRMISNAFVQAEMARWAVTAWAYGFGLIATPWVADPPELSPPGPTSEDESSRRWSPSASATSTPAIASASAPASPRVRALPVSTWRPSSTPLSPADRRRDRITFGVALLAVLTVSAPIMYQVRKHAPQFAAEAQAIADRARVQQVAALVRPNGRFSGRYRVERTLESAAGDPACLDGSAAAHWPVPSMETIAHDSASGTFQFLSRPEVKGRVSPQGDMEAGPIYGRKDGVEYAFSMVGRFSATGFEARSQTSTRTVIAWLTVERCQLTGRLSGRRVE